MGGNDYPEGIARARPRKSAEAFRTISEVADELNVPQHVLRFWETKFPRIKPLKRGGGRRYYRPEDVTLLRQIANLLYIQGYTIKGVQRLLKESGVLLEDVPPASPEEQAEATAEQNAELAADAGEARKLVEVQSHAPRQPVAAAAAAAPSDAEAAAKAEAARLRTVLIDILKALEALRADLQ